MRAVTSATLTVGRANKQQFSVCLDGRNQALPNGTGVQSYARTLAADLRRSGRKTALLLDGRAGKPSSGTLSRTLRAASPFSARAAIMPTAPPGFDDAWMARDVFRAAQIHFDIYGRLQRVRADHPPGLMHWTYPLPLAFDGVPNVYTIHDLIPLTHPALTGIDARRFERIVRCVIGRADHIVTVSETSRGEIMSLLGVPAEKVTNTYQSVTVPPPVAGEQAAVPGAYFLFCGTIEARKNLTRLISAYEASGLATPLILAGPDARDSAQVLGSAKMAVQPLSSMQPGGQHGVWRAPWLERPALLNLLRHARALLFPSLAEGFGLPIVEAMLLGVPVLTSRPGATGEIAGDAALLIDPTDIASMAAAITALDSNAELRAAYVARGLRRAAAFAPDRCMARLETIYRTLEARRQ